jgi:hypothetical protein
MKRCRDCGEEKPLTEFYAEKACKDGLRPECKACNLARRAVWYERNRAREIARVKAWQQRNRDRVNETQRRTRERRKPAAREDHLRRKFGITQADYERMLATQGGGCAICARAPRAGSSLHVDHDHESGEVRGLLCFRCNGGLGQFAEDEDRLGDAMAYLTRNDELHDAVVSRALALRVA